MFELFSQDDSVVLIIKKVFNSVGNDKCGLIMLRKHEQLQLCAALPSMRRSRLPPPQPYRALDVLRHGHVGVCWWTILLPDVPTNAIYDVQHREQHLVGEEVLVLEAFKGAVKSGLCLSS